MSVRFRLFAPNFTCPYGGTVDTTVLEAVAEMRESSNLSKGTTQNQNGEIDLTRKVMIFVVQ